MRLQPSRGPTQGVSAPFLGPSPGGVRPVRRVPHFINPHGPNILIDLPPAIANFPGYVEGRDIGAAFVRSLARPGANITGLSLSAGEDSTLAAKPLERHFQARRPDGVGPFPAVMLVPGRNGFLRNEEATHYARMADS